MLTQPSYAGVWAELGNSGSETHNKTGLTMWEGRSPISGRTLLHLLMASVLGKDNQDKMTLYTSLHRKFMRLFGRYNIQIPADTPLFPNPHGERGLPVPRGLGIFPMENSNREDSDKLICNKQVRLKFILKI